jgi:hypothetical protein
MTEGVPEHVAVRRFLRRLMAASREAGEQGLSLDDLGLILHDIAVGVLALEMSKVELMTHLTSVSTNIGMDICDVTGIIGHWTTKRNPLSDLRILGFRKSHSRFAEAAYAEFRGLTKYRQNH